MRPTVLSFGRSCHSFLSPIVSLANFYLHYRILNESGWFWMRKMDQRKKVIDLLKTGQIVVFHAQEAPISPRSG